MKKIHIIIFIISMSTTLNAQFNFVDQWPSRFKIGAEGGVSMVSFFGNPITEKSHINTLGFTTGAYFQYSFNQILHPDSTAKTTLHFGMKSGVYFDTKGAVTTPKSLVKAGLPPDSATTHTILNYITIPVMITFAMGREGRVKFYESIGPYFSVLVNQFTRRREPNGASSGTNEISKYNRFDVGLSLGFGIEIPFKQKFYLNVEFRQNVGLFNINQTAFPNNAIVQTNSSNLLIGFSYRFGRKKPYKEK
jgi:hypothetical protein